MPPPMITLDLETITPEDLFHCWFIHSYLRSLGRAKKLVDDDQFQEMADMLSLYWFDLKDPRILNHEYAKFIKFEMIEDESTGEMVPLGFIDPFCVTGYPKAVEKEALRLSRNQRLQMQKWENEMDREARARGEC